MTAQLFPNLPEQCEGPITVDGQSVVACPACHGKRGTLKWGEDQSGLKWTECKKCNGGGEVLVRA